MNANLPAIDSKQLRAVAELGILGSPEEQEYNSLVELVANVTASPVSVISIVDEDQLWFKARYGTLEPSVSRSTSFCAHTLANKDLFVVEDLAADPRFADNPLVTGPTQFRFYAGMPFKSPAGINVGVVCVLDTQPRRLTPAQLKSLQIVADRIGELLWLRVQNQQAATRTEELLADEQARHQQQLDTIGYTLHEVFAQELAACLKYIEVAQSSEELAPFSIARTQTVLQDMLDRMRQLSWQLQPAHFSDPSLPVLKQDNTGAQTAADGRSGVE